MHHTSGYIKAGNEQVHYLKTGSGSHLLLAFPGYGHEGNSMLPFAPYLAAHYTCIFIDHPHHGGSLWQQGAVFSRQMLKEMCLALMAQHHVKKISLLGFSMGGRVCLTIIEEMGELIDKVTLIASDGLSPNKYYFFFTRTAIGRTMFRRMLNDPAPYARVVTTLKDFKLISEWQHKFVSHYIGNEAVRKQLSLVWPAMSGLMPHQRKVLATIVRYNIQVTLFMGKYDKVIPAALGKKFASGATNLHLHILDKGHNIIGPDTAEQIAQTLL